MRRLLLALLAAAALPAAAPAAALPAPSPSVPVGGDLGGVRSWSAPDPSASLDGVALVVRAGLDREGPRRNGIAALTAETLLANRVDGVALRDALDAGGASLSYAITAQGTRWYLASTPDRIGAAAALVARAFAAPIAPQAFAAARDALAARAKDDEANPILVGLELFRSAYYRGGAGLPVDGSDASAAQFVPDDVRAFRDARYRRAGAAVALVGRADAAARGAAEALVAALGSGGDPDPALATNPPTDPSRRVVTHRAVGAPYVVLGFAAPSPGDPDYPAILVARALLVDLFDREPAETLPPYRRALGAVYLDEARPAALALYVNGAQVDPTTAVAALDAVLAGAAQKPIGGVLLARYRESAAGELAVAPAALADEAATDAELAARGLDPAYVARLPRLVAAVSAADVQRVVRRWLRRYTIALVLPREGAAR